MYQVPELALVTQLELTMPLRMYAERMMTMNCPVCSAENPESGKFCSECGVSLTTGEGQKEEPLDRFKTFVALLIAIVSIVGAALAYRIALAAGNAADADVAGIISSASLHQARVASEAELYRDLRAYLQVRIHDQLSHDLIAERDQYPSGDPARDRLWDEGWTETRVAEAYLDQIYISPEYIRSDGSYDEQAALDINIAHWALETDFNREGHFAEANRLRAKVQWLIGVASILTITLLFYTLAEVITHATKYLFLVLGTGTFIVAIIATLAIELIIS
jgi:predicted nucleic acid-binding Zn ribbon protein